MEIKGRVDEKKLKVKQKQRAEMLAANRMAVVQEKKRERDKFKIGEVFLNKFPDINELIERSSNEAFETNIEAIGKFIESVAECQKCWRELEDFTSELY